MCLKSISDQNSCHCRVWLSLPYKHIAKGVLGENNPFFQLLSSSSIFISLFMYTNTASE